MSLETASEVKWQVAWWALVPLALAAMTQPCGRVLDQETKNCRFYTRASPLVCISDVVIFLAMLVLGTVNEPPARWLDNAKYEIRRRFQGEAAGDPEAAESTLLVRWVLLIVGGVPCQTIKLVAMSGIPLTKTWASMYFISIIFGEVLIILDRRLNQKRDDAIAAVQHQTAIIPSWRRSKWPVLILEWACKHPVDFQWAAILLAPWYIGWVHPFNAEDERHVLCIFTAHALLTFRCYVDPLLASYFYGVWFGLSGLGWLMCWLTVWFISFLFPHLFPRGLFLVVLLGFLLSLESLSALISFFLPQFDIRLDYRHPATRGPLICAAVWALSLLYYAFGFDPAGTVNPDWTGVFG
ncbi:hypothetical protein CONLIGDRAFT_673150 [Coniochaeta ligniaria NRRL 30616]|uniref:Uncharacterized protein n=1 Tax=Coniochaeta ligniaria NRRL 30616 TaxID=1408157 RepID=A0A1J7J502_9PEZI|nr:hypothetical protein CONLIGDRAFT_673150 [Coniochaeta ligniaria NRRL 30616]